MTLDRWRVIENWQKELYPGRIVAHKVHRTTGEIYKIHGEDTDRPWAEVWSYDRGYEREEWPICDIAIRIPRLIKRTPRPFRFPREMPTLHCHCKVGRMEVQGKHEVKCMRCGMLLGSESFPNRVRKAEYCLRKKWGSQKGRSIV